VSDTAGIGVAGDDYGIQITAVDDSGCATSESVVRTATGSQCPSPCRIVGHVRSSTGPSIDRQTSACEGLARVHNH